MSASLFTELAWLPTPPADFRIRLRAIAAGDTDDAGRDLRFLASHALNINQLTELGRMTDRLRIAGVKLSRLTPLRLGLAGNSTSFLLGPALIASAVRHGLLLELIETDYGQAAQEALDVNSHLNRSKPEYVLLSFNHAGLPLGNVVGDDAAAERSVAEAVDFLHQFRGGLERGCGGAVIFETVPRPTDLLFGNYDLRTAGTTRQLVDTFNRALAESLRGTPHLLLDVAALAETVGLAEWHDPGQWNLAKLSFTPRMVPLYADNVGRLLAAAKGKSRRCLVLDLDNTLWGGIIGDDGLAGIVIGQGSPIGEAYLSVQATALKLRDRGIVLAVSSKNEEAIARLPFRKHPDMLLREDHIAVFQANWENKAANLKAIAIALSLGLESLVLLDDNPAEREQVRQAVPEVAVPELPTDPALYSRVLLASGLFEAISFSQEDRARAEYYQSNSVRSVLLQESGNLDSFLQSLEIVITFGSFDAVGRERITQLINKSNQFNLTTRRYTAVEVEAMERDPRVFTLQVRLADRFGDNGMISVVICRSDERHWDIDTWLMSCRVLGRRVEEAVLQEIARAARAVGVTRLRGVYIPTERNSLVREHYAKLGFTKGVESNDGQTEWVCDLESLPPVDLPMEMRWNEPLSKVPATRREPDRVLG